VRLGSFFGAGIALAAAGVLLGCHGPAPVRPVQGISCASEQDAVPARRLAIHFLTSGGYRDFRQRWHLSEDTARVAVVTDSVVCQRVARAFYGGVRDSVKAPESALAVIDLQKVYLAQEVGCELHTVEVDHRFRWAGIWAPPDADC
jgi:hypothetical protein